MTKSDGERFGRYLLLETIGKGGMAEIFRAIAYGVEGFERVFVVKRILKEKSASKEFIDMFVNEARISAVLHHPNIVQTYEFGQIDGSYFLAMEYLRGKDLLSVLRELRRRGLIFGPEVAAFVAQQVASGLGYAHSLAQGGRSLNIVHRDVSPSNIMLLRAGGVKLLDFGIAKAASDLRHSGTTQIGLIKGKLSYLSPEQVKGDPLDARSDVFSLGVVLWECLTGKRLFFDKNDYQTMRNVVERPVPPPSTQRPNIPAALDYIVVRALERDIEQRYPSAKQLADDLDNYLQEVRFSPQAMSRFLDELFGEDTGEELEQGRAFPSGPDEEGVALEPDVGDRAHLPEEGASRSFSNHVPPVSVTSRAGARLGSAGALLRRRGWLLAGAAAVTLVGGTALFARGRGQRPDAPVVEPALTASAPAAPAPGIVVGETPAPERKGIPEAVDIVSIRLDSDPSAAEVWGEDEAPLGRTPLTLTLRRSEAPVTLSLRKEGFEPLKHAIVPDRDLAALLSLRAEPAAPAPRTPGRSALGSRRVRSAGGAAKSAGAKTDGKPREGPSVSPSAGDAR